MKKKIKLTIYFFVLLLFVACFGKHALAADVFYSVGQTTNNLMTGTPTLTISSGTATFDTAQTGNIGVGDRVTYNQFSISHFSDPGDSTHTTVTATGHTFQNGDYVAISGTTNYNGTWLVSSVATDTFQITTPYVADDATGNVANIAYISAKTDTSHWSLVSPLGTTPNDVSSSQTVVSITREYTSLASAISGASDANHLNNSDLTSVNVALNFPCYYDSGPDTTAVTITGYTTSSSNYIKIYTPHNTSTEANQSQRHSGKWDESKYRLISYTSWSYALTISVENIVVDGLQITSNAINSPDNVHIDIANFDTTIKNCIIKNNEHGINITWNITGILKLYNSLINSTTFRGVSGGDAYSVVYYLYNNTFTNNKTAVSLSSYGSGEKYLKNNLFYNNTNDVYSGGLAAAETDYNVTDNDSIGYTVSGGGNTHDRVSQIISFVNATDHDFHLAPNDKAAREAGTDLSSDSNLPFSTDIDGDTRPIQSSWDIGADEGAIGIYRSVAPGATSALQTDNSHSDTVTISNGTATFSSALANNIGVGDVLVYDSDGDNDLDSSDSLAFIQERTDSTHYILQTDNGSTPADLSANDTWSIYRAYTSLANAENGTQNTSIPITFTGGNRDLVANNEQWNIACYANGTTADTTAVSIDGWTTGPNNFLKIYTPVDSDEVGVSQRHSGKWDESKYRLEKTGDNWTGVIHLKEEYVRIDGLQIKDVDLGDYSPSIILFYFNDSNSDIQISNNILLADYSQKTDGVGTGIDTPGSFSNKAEIWNNIIYLLAGSNYGVDKGLDAQLNTSDIIRNWFVYNNTIYGWDVGIHKDVTDRGHVVLKNNIVQNCTTDYYGTFDSSSDYNISSDDTAPGSHSKTNATVLFMDATHNDFHLSPNDTTAKDAGMDLSNDSNLSFLTDVDGESRKDHTWDIGADETLNSILKMKGHIKLRGVKIRN